MGCFVKVTLTLIPSPDSMTGQSHPPPTVEGLFSGRYPRSTGWRMTNFLREVKGWMKHRYQIRAFETEDGHFARPHIPKYRRAFCSSSQSRWAMASTDCSLAFILASYWNTRKNRLVTASLYPTVHKSSP